MQRMVDWSARQSVQRQVVERIHNAAQWVPMTSERVGAGAATVQRYSDVQAEGRNFRVSDDSCYRIPDNDPTCLQVRKGATGPEPENFFDRQSGPSADWEVWEPKAQFMPLPSSGWYEEFCGPNDCGRYATGLASHDTYWGNATNGLQNFDINPFAINENVRPGLGEMAYTVPLTLKPDRCNFHAMAPVIQAGNDRISSEADAGDAGRTRPYWRMYGTSHEQTFHGTFQHTYGDRVSPDVFVGPITVLYYPNFNSVLAGLTASPSNSSPTSPLDFAMGVDDSGRLTFEPSQPHPSAAPNATVSSSSTGQDDDILMSDAHQSASGVGGASADTVASPDGQFFVPFSDVLDQKSDVQLAWELFGPQFTDTRGQASHSRPNDFF